MIHHVVLFKTSDAGPARAQMLAGLAGLQNEIESLRYIKAGVNFSERSQGFDCLLYSAFNSREGLDEYQVHPTHKREVAERVKPLMQDILVGDFESPVAENISSTIIHAVLFRFQPGTDDAAIAAAQNQLNALATQISSLDFITAGRNFSDRGKEHALVLVSGFASRAALDEYIAHPAHVEAVNNFIKPIVAGITVGDFEIDA